jgi:hypothetical protein
MTDPFIEAMTWEDYSLLSAWHESGHAVAGFLVGGLFSRMRIGTRPECFFTRFEDRHLGLNGGESEIVFHFGGRMGVELINEEWARHGNDSDDSNIAEVLEEDGAAIRPLHELEALARRLVSDNAEAVEKVSEQLLQRKKMYQLPFDVMDDLHRYRLQAREGGKICRLPRG